MVRLKVVSTPSGTGPISAFQFQYGAIKGFSEFKQNVLTTRFQFQYGAIKGGQIAVILNVYFCFNSSMVRLKAFCSITNLLPF